MRLTRRQHPVVARFRDLAAHPSDTHALLDGDHLISEALDAGVPLEIVLGDAAASGLMARAAATGATVYEGSADVLTAARPVRGASGGIVAVARWTPLTVAAVFERSPTLAVGLVDVQDPGNVGGTVRSADALGADAVLALGDSANPAGWKALRGAMGSTFHIPVGRGGVDDAVGRAHQSGLAVAATVAEGGLSIEDADLTRPMLVLVGNEGAGLKPTVIDCADVRLTVPMRHRVNSLNVSVTVALVLWTRHRQARPAERTPA